MRICLGSAHQTVCPGPQLDLPGEGVNSTPESFPTKAPPASQIIRDPEQKGHHLLTYQGVARASFASFVVGYPISFRCPDLQYIWENQGETK